MTVDENKIKKIQEIYLNLPEDVQKALFSTKTSDAIFEVGKKHELAIDKMGELADETGLVMLGMTKPNEYIRNLEKRLGVEILKAKEIAEDINQKVFSPIRESLKKIHGIPHPTTPSPYKGEGGREENVRPISPIKLVSPLSPPAPPENLPVEKITPPYPPIGEPPLLTTREVKKDNSVTSNIKAPIKISQKVNEILKKHEAIKQKDKRIMPEQPANIKVGEIAKAIEPKVEIKPYLSGRIEMDETETQIQEIKAKKEKTVPKTETPNIFLKKIPTENHKIEPALEEVQQIKNTLEKELTPEIKPYEHAHGESTQSSIVDPYKEPTQ